jgi:3-hydroxyacyl-CoA dehydrogenase
MSDPRTTKKAIAIVGSGTIGCSWAAAFARYGYPVRVFDASADARRSAPAVIDSMVRETQAPGGEPAIGTVSVVESIEDAVSGASYLQESVTENPAVKQEILEEISRKAPPDCILASSTSAILPSKFLRTVVRPERALVAHPFNPPHLVPLVELVPSPWTDAAITEATRALLAGIGQQPIVVRAEIEGFVGNRLQAAVICEAMHLVASGVVSPGDLDRCMVYGLGRRWAFMGPFQTMALNSLAGFGDYVRKYKGAYLALARSLELTGEWRDETIDDVDRYLERAGANDPEYLDRASRDKRLARLAEFHAASLRYEP